MWCEFGPPALCLAPGRSRSVGSVVGVGFGIVIIVVGVFIVFVSYDDLTVGGRWWFVVAFLHVDGISRWNVGLDITR